ncbi:MAG: hypothetical protein AAF909_07535 [Pseudomonadota bacterium]
MIRAFAVAAMLTAASLSGCSVYMAANSEGKRDTNILTPGTTRAAVLAELGQPVATVPVAPPAPAAEDAPSSGVAIIPAPIGPSATPALYDVFRFTQERSTGSNAGRAVFYGAAAVLTLGLSEVIATPLEAAVGDAGEIRLRVFYGADDRVQRAEVLDGEVWKAFGPGVAP